MKTKGIQLGPSQISEDLSPTQISQFLEDFRNMHISEKSSKKLISLRIDSDLLEIFKSQCKDKKVSYQKQIRLLMAKWVSQNIDTSHFQGQSTPK